MLNAAPSDGGGILFWQGIFPLENCQNHDINVSCNREIYKQTALFGSCIASEYKTLLVSNAPNFTYPGILFSLSISKIDAYNQTIASDSSLIVKVVSSIYMQINVNPDKHFISKEFYKFEEHTAHIFSRIRYSNDTKYHIEVDVRKYYHEMKFDDDR